MLAPAAFVLGAADEEPGEVVLRIGFMEKVDHLNPNCGLSETSSFFYGLLYDGLVALGPGMEPVPNLATSWRVVPGSDPELVASGEPYGSVWEYEVTTNATWHDGVPFSADDVEYTFNLMSEEFDAFWAHEPLTYFASYAEVVGDNTVRIHFFDRETDEPMACSFGDSLYVPILPKHKLETFTAEDIGFSWTGVFDDDEVPIVATGPFQATPSIWDDYEEGVSMNLTRNEDCHLSADYGIETCVDRIEMVFFDEADEVCSALENGSIDIASLSQDAYVSLQARQASGGDANISMGASLGTDGRIKVMTYSLVLTSEANPIIMDPAVRRAISHATDRAMLLESAMCGLGVEGSTLVSPAYGDWHCELTDDEEHEFDVQLAKQILDDAGYPYSETAGVRVAGEDSLAVTEAWVPIGEPLNFTFAVERGDQSLGTLLSDLLSEELNVSLLPRLVDPTVIPLQTCPVGDSIGLFEFDYHPTPYSPLFTQSSRALGDWSDNSYSDPDYDGDFNMSVASLGIEDRLGYVHECQRAHYEDVWYLVLAYPYDLFAWRTDRFDNISERMSDPCTNLGNVWGGAATVQALSELETEDIDGDPGADASIWDEPLLWAAVLAAVVVATVAALFLVNRRNKAPKA
jgi:peptide/nickel transport system substrate-binding protein